MLDLLARNRVVTLLAVTVVFSIVVGTLAPGFLAVGTLARITSSSLILLLVSIGTMLVILTRNIDVSIGSILGLSAVVLGLALDRGMALPVAIGLAVGTGAAAGAFNGLLVAVLNVPSIVATLGTLGLFRGLMLVATGGRWIEELPTDLKALAGPVGFGLSPLAFMAGAVLAGTWLFLARTRWGGFLYAVGDNRDAARHLGIPLVRTQFGAFVAAGVCAALAGLVFAAQIGFVPNQAGSGIELKAIAANVLGGVSLLGGVGSVLGVAISVVFLTSIDTALVFLRIPAFWNEFIAGAMLLAVLMLDGRMRRMIDARMRARRYVVHDRTAPSAGQSRFDDPAPTQVGEDARGIRT